MHWMLMPYRHYVQFWGRSRRREYWSFSLLYFLVMLVLLVPAAMLGERTGDANSTVEDNLVAVGANGAIDFSGNPLAAVLWGLFLVFVLASLLPGLAVTVRRLHDRNMSGWWLVGVSVLSLLPLLGFFVWIAFIVIMLLDGTEGPNRYGPDPKARTDAEIFA